MENTKIISFQPLIRPDTLKQKYPITESIKNLVMNTRQEIRNIIKGISGRKLFIIGPCSIHNVDEALVYAKELKQLADRVQDKILIVMRVYFEKPRTTVGWKGLINDPNLDNSFNINKGISLARQLLRDLNDLGVCAGTEFLDVITPQYLADLVSWGAIGARTTESQVHRELASGMSCPIGFKNTTEGDVKVAVDALKSAKMPHMFLSVTKEGRSAVFSSAGNDDCHVILRGGKEPNYGSESIEDTANLLTESGLKASMMVDMSHGNSSKQYKKQIEVCNSICSQLLSGESRITGVMIESNLVEGNQSITRKRDLVYGQSITDACLSWEDTRGCLESLSEAIIERRQK